MFVVRFSVHLLPTDPADKATPRHWRRMSTRVWPGVPREGDLVSLDDQDQLCRPLAMAIYCADFVDLEFREGLTAADIPLLRRLGFRPTVADAGDQSFEADLPSTNLREQLLAECLKRLVRGDNRDDPAERCWRAFTETLGLDPDQNEPYAAKQLAAATYRMAVDVFAELAGLATHHENHGWPSDPETLVAVSAVEAFHKAVSEPDIPEDERASAHVEALVQCLGQWVTEIPLGLADAVRDLDSPDLSRFLVDG